MVAMYQWEHATNLVENGTLVGSRNCDMAILLSVLSVMTGDPSTLMQPEGTRKTSIIAPQTSNAGCSESKSYIFGGKGGLGSMQSDSTSGLSAVRAQVLSQLARNDQGTRQNRDCCNTLDDE